MNTDKLADALWQVRPGHNSPSGARRLVSQEHLCTLAREAAKQALKEAADDFSEREGVEVTMFANDNIEAIRAMELWLRFRADQI